MRFYTTGASSYSSDSSDWDESNPLNTEAKSAPGDPPHNRLRPRFPRSVPILGNSRVSEILSDRSKCRAPHIFNFVLSWKSSTGNITVNMIDWKRQASPVYLRQWSGGSSSTGSSPAMSSVYPQSRLNPSATGISTIK
ncbi:hypothetical protein TB2_030418 [Malus domestica]